MKSWNYTKTDENKFEVFWKDEAGEKICAKIVDLNPGSEEAKNAALCLVAMKLKDEFADLFKEDPEEIMEEI